MLFVFFLSWLNTTMMENRVLLDASDLDGFEKVNHMLLFVYNYASANYSFNLAHLLFHPWQEFSFLVKKFCIL